MDGYLTSEQLAERLGIQRTSIHRYRTRGDIPEPDEYVGRTPLWRETNVDQWIAARPSSTWQRKLRKEPAPE